MQYEFTPIFETEGPWYIAHCPEVPGANGQGLTREDCLQNLRAAIELILEDRRETSGVDSPHSPHSKIPFTTQKNKLQTP